MPTRVTLARLARDGSDMLRLAALFIGGRWVMGMEVGRKGVFGGPAWWAAQRKLHGLLWLGYALTDRWQFLAGDTAFAALNWLTNSPKLTNQ